jgi:hypothetical protein
MKYVDNYPEVNLSDVTVVAKQFQNTTTFKKRWSRVIIGILGIVSVAIVGVNFLRAEESGWITLFVFAFGIPTTFFVMKYRCPNCATIPSGTSFSLTDKNASYAKGFHPFPKRCACCGYYLSQRALESDLKKL